MSINIQAKTNYSFLFSGLSSSASNALSGNWLADYASIKNGSYAKLMKAYYGKENNASNRSFRHNEERHHEGDREESTGQGRDRH